MYERNLLMVDGLNEGRLGTRIGEAILVPVMHRRGDELEWTDCCILARVRRRVRAVGSVAPPWVV